MNAKIEVTKLITPFLELTTSTFKGFKDLFNIGLQSYLESHSDKLYLTNTFLHPTNKVRFLETYFKVTSQHGRLKTKFNDLYDLFDEYNYIAVVGTAGSGKSMLSKYIFLNSIKQKFKIPIIIELRNLSTETLDIDSYIKKYILNNKIKENDFILSQALESGKFLFLLDGFDEIYSQEKQIIAKEINAFIDRYYKNSYVIFSRPYSGAEQIPRFLTFSILPLSDYEIKLFISQNINQEEKKLRILELFNQNEDITQIKKYLENPLLLSMFILTIGKHPEIPKKRSAYYQYVFDTLYSTHEGLARNNYVRERRAGLYKDEYEKILQAFSYLTFMKGKFSFSEKDLFDNLSFINRKNENLTFQPELLIEDLLISISILLKDGLDYKFPHRSLQEYFCSVFIKELQTEKKQTTYDRYNKLISNNKLSSNVSFWNLCSEIDELSFNKYFRLPIINEFLNQVNTKDEDSFITTVFDLLGFRIRLSNPLSEKYLTIISFDYFSSKDQDFNNKFLHLTINTGSFVYFEKILTLYNKLNNRELTRIIINELSKNLDTKDSIRTDFKMSEFYSSDFKLLLTNKNVIENVYKGVENLQNLKQKFIKFIDDEDDFFEQIIEA